MNKENPKQVLGVSSFIDRKYNRNWNSILPQTKFGMEALRTQIRNIINTDDDELNQLLSYCFEKSYKKGEVLSLPGAVPDAVFFIVKGLLRVVISTPEGVEHSVHFAMENQFIADYSSFLLQHPGIYTLQALEQLDVIVMPRKAIDWGYSNMVEGNKFGRKVAEYYFIYQDHRVKNMYSRTPKERYDAIEQVFPGIHFRVPQHMIASYLGITPVHLSRLKKSDSRGKLSSFEKL